MLTIHKPWSKNDPISNENIVDQFLKFIQSSECPSYVRLPYERAKHRRATGDPEPTSKHEPCLGTNLGDDVDPTLVEAMHLWGTIASLPLDDCNSHDYDFGEDYDWNTPTIEIPYRIEEASNWLPLQIKKEEEIEGTRPDIDLPVKIMPDGSKRYYEIEDLAHDQKVLICEILSKINEWVKLGKTPNGNKCKQLFLTVRGRAGSGKSTLIHTLVTAIRRKFNCNDSVVTFAPTGAAAHAINGKTAA